jgi:hypothetical protein
MTSRLLPATLLLAFGLLLPGCATFSDNELGIIRSSGVSPRVYDKMQNDRVLHPEDIIELTRRHVPSRYIVRQIEDTGVDYVLSKEDFKRLQNAQVNRDVLDALIAASEDFSGRYAGPHHHVYVDAYPYPYYDPYYYGPYPYAYPYPYYGGSFGVGVVVGPRHCWHHW